MYWNKRSISHRKKKKLKEAHKEHLMPDMYAYVWIELPGKKNKK